jgi:hypothetical protein
MKLAILCAALLSFLFAGVSFAAEESSATAKKGPVYHVVCVKFKDGTTPDQIKAAEEAFAELKTKIPTILTLHWGTNVSPEHKNKGFTHCFVLTFATTKDRDAYLVDPAHKAFGKEAGPHFADVFVIDFEAQD